MSDELKSCPFCGGKVEISTYRNEGYQIECPNHEWPKREMWMEKRAESDIAADIGMYTWGISDEAKAALIEAWNTRANEPADCGTVEDGASQVPELDTREHMDNGVSVHMCPNGHSKNLARHSKASQVFSDGFSDGENGISEQDTRERIERCLRVLLGLRIDKEPDPMTSGIYYNILGLLDRQAAITEYEYEERECEIVGAWQDYLAKVEDKRDELKTRVAELTAERDMLQGANEFLADAFKGIQAERDQFKAKVDSLREALDACGTGTMYELWRRDHTQLKALRAAQHDKPGT